MPIQLLTRSAGQVIIAGFFNDILNALEGDFVGRDVNGNPVSGNNLGTSAFPWGAMYCTQAIIGGTALSTASLENPPFQIVSGKVRSGSNQPAFLLAAGSSNSFSLLATTTPLVLSIAGVSATWSTDKAGIAGVVAPSTQNTATINDATAAGQAATRTWGEYGSGSPYVVMQITGAGTNITNQVGSVQAFKIGTEYFIAYVESTTTLSRAFRGYFFNSSGNPVPRVTFSNGATVTLMNLGYVFADSNGTTVDTIFTGLGVNNQPKYSFTAPSSPLTGDYWYDLGNNVWKRYSGAWSVVNRILVGLVVCDSSNCVAARSFDFFGQCRADNTVELGFLSNTQLQITGLRQRINVNGKRIDFGTNRQTWDTASNLAASTDRYNATVQASTTEYFYVTDQGDVKISDMEPYWRADLLGWFHPFNPWRQVSSDYTDGSAHFQSATLLNAYSINKPPPNRVVSPSSGTFFTASTSFVNVTGVSCTIVTHGRPVKILLIDDGTGSTASVIATATSGALQITGGNNTMGPVTVTTPTAWPPSTFQFEDSPPAGVYTYQLQVKAGSASQTQVPACKLVVWELD